MYLHGHTRQKEEWGMKRRWGGRGRGEREKKYIDQPLTAAFDRGENNGGMWRHGKLGAVKAAAFLGLR